MKICYISNLYPPAVLGGAEIIVQKTAKAMKKRGHDVVVITTTVDSDEHIIDDDGIKLYQLNTTPLYPPYKQTEVGGIKKPLWHAFDLYNSKTRNRICEILEDEDVDIIHLNNYNGLSMSVFEVGCKLGIPLIFESHDFSLICPRANLIRGNNTLCLKCNIACKVYVDIQRRLLGDNVDVLISPSNFMINKYKENNFFKNTRCVKIPLATDKKTTKTTKSYDTIDITYIGTLGKHKGVQTIIEAFKQIDNEKLRLHIVGKGYDEQEFKQMAEGDERIIFYGFVENSEIEKFYDMSNIIIIASICYDNSPMVIYESFSRSTPVIGSNIGGIPELITNGYNGLLFEADNPSDLKDKIIKLADDVELLKSFEDNASKTLPNDSMKIMIDKLEKEYENILEK